mmetsp:Transcript_25331/g.88425  ORF Transcript_25331/g.88425 Transcript_25331/m.88425 type:complete len:298 (-) Transcript_25331:124-1017(-)
MSQAHARLGAVIRRRVAAAAAAHDDVRRLALAAADAADEDDESADDDDEGADRDGDDLADVAVAQARHAHARDRARALQAARGRRARRHTRHGVEVGGGQRPRVRVGAAVGGKRLAVADVAALRHAHRAVEAGLVVRRDARARDAVREAAGLPAARQQQARHVIGGAAGHHGELAAARGLRGVVDARDVVGEAVLVGGAVQALHLRVRVGLRRVRAAVRDGRQVGLALVVVPVDDLVVDAARRGVLRVVVVKHALRLVGGRRARERNQPDGESRHKGHARRHVVRMANQRETTSQPG